MSLIDELRKDFEEIEWVTRMLKGGYIYWDGERYELNKINKSKVDHELYSLHYLNLGFICGGWIMFQELRK